MQKLIVLCFNKVPSVMGSTFSSEQVEECDFEEDRNYSFERICGTTHKITHKTNISSHQVLFIAKIFDNTLPAFALRHDVDGCLWQPEINGDEFSLKHIGTLLAFGYIQASKQQRKFSSCAPDMSYSVICESSRHAFIYCQQKSVVSGELRNRTSGRKINSVAEQQVISLPNDEVLGLFSSEKYLYLLFSNQLLLFCL